MAFYDKFPYTNFQELNLDWLTQEVSKVRDNRDATDASAAAALDSEKAAKASETAAAASQQAAKASQQAAAGSEAASADYLAQIGTHTAGAAADWLKENLTPTTPPVDASLTVSGAAADAKKTGDAVSELKEDLSNYVIKTADNASGYYSELTLLTTDGTNDANKIGKSIIFPVVDLNADNMPTNNVNGFFVSIKASDKSFKYGRLQLIFHNDGRLSYYRNNWFYDENKWSEWVNIGNENQMINDKITLLDNLTFKQLNNSYYLSGLFSITSNKSDDFNYINQNVFACVLNLHSVNKPSDFENGFIISLKGSTNTYGRFQLLLDNNGEVSYYRANWVYDETSWTEWKRAITNDNVLKIVNEKTEQFKPINNINYCLGFKRVLILGDSISEGLMPTFDDSFALNKNYSWSNITFSNAEVENIAQSGATPKTYFTDNALNNKLNNVFKKNELCVIYLGTNNQLKEDGNIAPVGTTNDIVATYTDTPSETIVGYYSKLIRTVKHNTTEYMPIILVTPAGKTENMIEAVNILSEYFGVDKLIISDNDELSNIYYSLANNDDGNHFSALGYVSVAKAIEIGINKLIKNNSLYYRNTAKILNS